MQRVCLFHNAHFCPQTHRVINDEGQDYIPNSPMIPKHRRGQFGDVVHVGCLLRPGCTTTSKQSYCQGGRTSAASPRATQPRCTDVPDWVTTSAVQPTFGGLVTVCILIAMIASWHPTGATLAEGRRSGMLSCTTRSWTPTAQPNYTESPTQTDPTLYLHTAHSNTQEVKNERFLIWTRQNNVRIFRQMLPSTKRRTEKEI